MLKLLAVLMQSKMVKVSAGAVGGSSLLALIFSLHTDLGQRIEENKIQQKEYVELVLKPIETEIRNLKDNTKETKEMVRDIRNHLLEKQ